jgi:hypothetical protein
MKTLFLFSLNLTDLGKCLLVAVGGAVIAAIENVLQAGSFSFNWESHWQHRPCGRFILPGQKLLYAGKAGYAGRMMPEASVGHKPIRS